MKRAMKRIAIDDVAAHNQRMWDRLSAAGIPYTRPQGTPPKTSAAKRRFLSVERLLETEDFLRGGPVPL